MQNQCIAIGDGVNYKKIEGNPVVTGEMLPEGYSRVDFRDPKVWEENGIYYMLTCSRDEKKWWKSYSFFKSGFEKMEV